MTKYFLRAAGLAVLTLAVIMGCATAQPVAPVESAIQVETSGFSPFDTTGSNTIEVSLLMGNSDALKTWKVEIINSGTSVKSWTGDAMTIPAAVRWDGMNDFGKMAAEGSYTARLSLDYGTKYQPAMSESRSFVLDLTSPTGAISLDPKQFTPNAKGAVQPVVLTINAHSALAHMESWSLDVFDSTGGLVNSWSGMWPNASVSWDGSSLNGGVVVPDSGYSAVAYVRDEYGNSGRLTTSVAVAALPQAPPAPVLVNRDPSIVALSTGFSPNGDNIADTLTLDISYGRQPTAVTAWQVLVMNNAGEIQKTWTGEATGLLGAPGMGREVGQRHHECRGNVPGKAQRPVQRRVWQRQGGKLEIRAGRDPAHGSHFPLVGAFFTHRVDGYNFAESGRELESREDRQLDHGHP